ncbi:hypothetical protein HYO65_gp214 [Tenacibaculum phage PTm1]|uniref:Uncharacterized protein n=1 Tax=Tenacibaculum phage PTm1 TaxID=2547425 RepID=A0A5S9HXB6_9CAUD|nr:hypothetical protein HYO65_gp214 [Tenacibaculum phage PTm1]BBI90606.1 hypothetical protein [Tenacibaculum phage PTm1]
MYVNYTDVFKTIIDKIELPRRVSATSYGLGIEAIFGTREENFKDMHAVGDKLKEYGIEFTYGASEAEWVRQIRISKKQSNIDRIKALK